MIFDYPPLRKSRRHGPYGYLTYESYRAWLRDEFTFRCVYCLRRETWGRLKGEFDLDHFRPVDVAPERGLDYSNLVYVCHTCNLIKLNGTVGDPLSLLTADKVVTLPDGSLQSSHPEAVRLIRVLELNSDESRRWRWVWMEMEKLSKERPDLANIISGFPQELPDLSRQKPPGNRRPQGIKESWFEQRGRGDLPDSY